jgi:hypothetical protein
MTFLCIPKLHNKETTNSLALSLPDGPGPTEAQWQSFPRITDIPRRYVHVGYRIDWYTALSLGIVRKESLTLVLITTVDPYIVR